MVKPEKKKIVVDVVPLPDEVVLHALSHAYRAYTLTRSLSFSDSFEKVALAYFKMCGVEFVMKKDVYDSI